MKLLIAILAVVGAFMLTIGVLPNGHDAEERMSNALLALQMLDGQYLLVVPMVLGKSHLLRHRRYSLDETPTYAEASWQSQFAHLVREINQDG